MDYLKNSFDMMEFNGRLNTNSNNLNCIKAILVAGLYPNVVRIDKINNRLINEFVKFFSKIVFLLNSYLNI